ncbi:hypothetical protein BCV69DRAFT_283507 [Microstroma glucosiphilum]|uniref:Uncharacterized protein n=1 Tax=Pseudomicrostroma glucosiphilum TaxID=1684307 RepID=A0A316U3V7_9BASI|nr:hypothetical protein BCV69DRAFT_283507 [Pseudomicrostroma glucosiphilum]PWN19982.1 hypothetical protein BCV69DRAFT_283507 [Pseudomicrostroma glucosiphilum]
MSEAYAGKSNEQIINEQAASLDSKSSSSTSDSFQPRTTVTSEESGVNESGLGEFPGAEVHVGRTGATGGGTSAQNIPPEEGGQDSTGGESSARFEGLGGPEDKKAQTLADAPGSYDANPRGIDETFDRSKKEPVPMTEGQQLEPDQEETARLNP